MTTFKVISGSYAMQITNSIIELNFINQTSGDDSLLLWDNDAQTLAAPEWAVLKAGCFLTDLGLKGEWWVVWFTHHWQCMTDNYMIVTEHSAHSDPF